MSHILFFVYILVIASILAKLEIAIEGPDGWAGKLPTWRLSADHIVSKIFLGGRPMTGYHLWMNLFSIFILHSTFLFNTFSWVTELKVISAFILIWVIEDFLWFVLNPAYGIKNFVKEKIWWHEKRWFIIAPVEYFTLLPLGIILYIISTIIH